MTGRLKTPRLCDCCSELYYPWSRVREGERGYCSVRCRSDNQPFVSTSRRPDPYGRTTEWLPVTAEELAAFEAEVDQWR